MSGLTNTNNNVPFYAGEKLSATDVYSNFLKTISSTVKACGYGAFWLDHYFHQLPNASRLLPVHLRPNPLVLQTRLQRFTSDMGHFKNFISFVELLTMKPFLEFGAAVRNLWTQLTFKLPAESVDGKPDSAFTAVRKRMQQVAFPAMNLIRCGGAVVNNTFDAVNFWGLKYVDIKPSVPEYFGKALGISSMLNGGVSAYGIYEQVGKFKQIWREKAAADAEEKGSVRQFWETVTDKRAPVRLCDIINHSAWVALGTISAHFMYANAKIPKPYLTACTTAMLFSSTFKYFWTNFFDPERVGAGYHPKFQFYGKDKNPEVETNHEEVETQTEAPQSKLEQADGSDNNNETKESGPTTIRQAPPRPPRTFVPSKGFNQPIEMQQAIRLEQEVTVVDETPSSPEESGDESGISWNENQLNLAASDPSGSYVILPKNPQQ